MRHDETLRRQATACVERAETSEACGGSILYVDEQHFTRECISHELARQLPEFTIIERSTARDFTSRDPAFPKIALVILYVHADRINLRADREDLDDSGIAAQLSILEDIAPDTPRVLMSEVEVPEDILEAFRRRVRGYLPTTLPIKQVAEAIRFIAVGGTFVPQSILSLHTRASLVQEEPRGSRVSDELEDFSPRQNEVLRLLWNGSSNKVIAYELRMSESTVKVHIRHIMKKLNVNNRTQVVLRTRPQRFDKVPSAGPTVSPSALCTATAVPSISEDRRISAPTNGRPLELSREVGMHNNVHRG